MNFLAPVEQLCIRTPLIKLWAGKINPQRCTFRCSWCCCGNCNKHLLYYCVMKSVMDFASFPTLLLVVQNTLYQSIFFRIIIYHDMLSLKNVYCSKMLRGYIQGTVWSDGFLYKVARPELKNSPIMYFVIHNSVVLSKLLKIVVP